MNQQLGVSLGHTGGNKGTGNNLEILETLRRVFKNVFFYLEGKCEDVGLTKNFMVDDDTALICVIQLIPWL